MRERRVIAVFGGSAATPGDSEYLLAVEAGRLLAEAGFGVATGGYGGVMEAAALGASTANGSSIGYTAPTLFPERDGPNEHIDIEVPAKTLTQRLDFLVERSAGFLVMPGSIGTLTELVVAWNSAFITRFSGQAVKPVAAVGDPWKSLVPHLADALNTDASLVTCWDEVGDAVEFLARELG